MYRSTVKATPANIRRRLHAILDAAISLEDVAGRYNPKGRLSTPTRRAYRLAQKWHEEAGMLLETFNRASRAKR